MCIHSTVWNEGEDNPCDEISEADFIYGRSNFTAKAGQPKQPRVISS